MSGIITASKELPFLVLGSGGAFSSQDGVVLLEVNGRYLLSARTNLDLSPIAPGSGANSRLALFDYAADKGFAFVEILRDKTMDSNGNPPFVTDKRIEVLVEGREIAEGRRIEIITFSMKAAEGDKTV